MSPPKTNIDVWAGWVALKAVPGIGDRLYWRLIKRFQTPSVVIQKARETPTQLHDIPGISARLISAIARGKETAAITREIERVQKMGFRLVTMADPDYPPMLLEIPDPPPYLYLAGTLPQTIKQIAIVGSRNATTYGIETTRKLSADLTARDAVVVSGMALGIDTAAHEGALVDNGKTVAVLGSGLLKIYPAQNRGLFDRIVENGAVISEFPLNAGPEAHHFPKRNRIISGISLGTVVVEATRRSGSLITARLAAEQNRDVFAVPGSIQSFKSTGTHTLIKQGAKLVENVQDVLEEFPRFFDTTSTRSPRTKAQIDLNRDQQAVFDVLSAYPIHIDDLARQTGMDAGRLAGLLMQMELSGFVSQAPGKMFTRHMDFC